MFRALCFLLAWAAVQSFIAHAQGTCGPSPLGDPCSQGGLAVAPGAEPGLNLGAGNPINLATGNKYQKETDLPVNPDAPGIEVVRHYNAQDRRASALGPGWVLSYDTRLFQLGSRWQIVQADGSRITFAGASGQPLANAHGTLSGLDGGWAWRWPDGTQLWFDAKGFLARINTASGTTLHLLRSTEAGPLANTLASVQNDKGTVLLFGYRIENDRAYLAYIDTPRGRFHYQHDSGPNDGHAAGPRLTGVTRPDGMQRRYLYEARYQAGNSQALTGIKIVSAQGETQRVNTWAYDAQSRAILSIAGGPESLTGKVSLRFLQAPGGGQPGLTIASNAQGQETRFQITVKGGRPVLTHVSGAGCAGCASPGMHADYDDAGRLTRVNGTRIQRDASGAIQRLLVPDTGWPGLAIDYQSNGLRLGWSSSLTGSERIQYDSKRLPVQRVFANGDSVRYDYDALRRPVALTETTARAQHQTQLGWRATLLTHISHPNEKENREYDSHNRLRRRQVNRITAHPGQSRLRYAESFEYDTEHRLARHELPEGGALTYTWHPSGRLASIHWHPVHGPARTVLDSDPATPGYRYGNGLHLYSQLNGHGHADTLVLAGNDTLVWRANRHVDTHGRPLRERNEIPAAGYADEWSYAYDGKSRLVGARGGVTLGGSPEEGQSTAGLSSYWYAWDKNGSMAASRQNGSTRKPDIRRDSSGLPSQALGYQLEYGPDRRLARVRRDGATLARYQHNAYGHRIAVRSPQADIDYFYLDNRLVAERRHAAPGNADLTRLPANPEPWLRLSRRYIHAGPTLVAIIDYHEGLSTQGVLYWAHSDLIGAPRLLTDADQQIRWLGSYSPLGAAQRIRGDLSLDLRLPGQVHDAATGWHDNLLRSYLPAWGHYLEPDPLGPIPGSQALGYAAQQPRRHADPLGLVLFAFDGTRHSPDTQTNVWKLSQAYRDGPVFYHSGPGNSMYLDWDAVTAGHASQILDTQWQSLLNVLGSKTRAVEHIPIDIIGFSRGAALARHFGNLVQRHTQGMLFSYNDTLRGPINACVDLRFMGLFDTVAQFGVAGSANANYDLTIAPAWEWVAHAVALHERRWTFPLTAAGDADGTNIVEAPFIGAHADIGGGALRSSDGEPTRRGDLSDVALNWMLWQARAASLNFDLANPDDREITVPILHDERAAAIRSIQDGDRSVQRATGAILHDYQDDHAQLGRDVRSRTEALIDRYKNWRASAGSEVGMVDMSGYAQWLHDELGWQAVPGRSS